MYVCMYECMHVLIVVPSCTRTLSELMPTYTTCHVPNMFFLSGLNVLNLIKMDIVSVFHAIINLKVDLVKFALVLQPSFVF